MTGFVRGISAAVTTVFVQSRIRWTGSLADYDHWLVLGTACGFGALPGDALKGFFNRRLGIAPGKPWIPADQLDFVVGGLIALSFVVALDWIDISLVVLLSFVGDILVNRISFRLGVRETKW